jgi:hypothetical protein
VMRLRAWRRHQDSRIKQRVRHYYGGYAKDKPRHLGRFGLCWCHSI